jgi:PAS domain S-box-containing protein
MRVNNRLQSSLRLLNDSAHSLESLESPQARIRRVLEILNGIVPYDGCVLIEAGDDRHEPLSLPEMPKRNLKTIEAALLPCLDMVGGEPYPTFTSQSTPQIVPALPWRSYLGLPLFGNDRVIGLLFVGSNESGAYDEMDLSLLSVVAGQLAAYMTSVRLHEEELTRSADLADSVNYANHLFQSSLMGIAQLQDNLVLDANGFLLRMLGYDRTDLASGLDWRTMTPPEYRPLDDQAFKELENQDEVPPYEKEFFRKDGSTVPVLIGAAVIQRKPLRMVCFVVDLTKRKRIEEELERTRSEFLGEVSHELKTPLTAIKGSTSIALTARTPPSEVEARELFTVIDEQAERLRELIANLLDMTRIEAGSLSVNPQPEQLSTIIEEAVETFQRTTEEHPVMVVLPPALPPVNADRRRIAQVIMNLLSNAAKASPADSPMTIFAEPHNSQVIVTVRDRGRGIAADKLPLLFRKFSQIHDSGGRGTGLGLAICKGIVEAHGGHIWAESAGEGEGASFNFALPIPSDTRK